MDGRVATLGRRYVLVNVALVGLTEPQGMHWTAACLARDSLLSCARQVAGWRLQPSLRLVGPDKVVMRILRDRWYICSSNAKVPYSEVSTKVR